MLKKFLSAIKSIFTKSKDAKEITQLPPRAPKREPGDDVVLPKPVESADIRGIDVSHHQGVIDWKKVAASGVRFVFIKATEGATYTDPNFFKNALDAKAAGLLIGAYHFLRDGSDGIAQSHHFLKQTSLVDLDLPLVLDWERSDSKDEAKEFLNRIITWKGKAIIYGGHIIKSENLGKEYLQYPLWVSHYDVTAPILPKPWNRYTFWQYSDAGVVPGIKGKCDMNLFNGTMDELRGMK